MDDETARIAFQLQLEDLQEVASKSKGKQRAGQLSDFELALKCYEAELKSNNTFVSDRKMCMSIASAVQRDGNVIKEMKAQEDQAIADRRLALESQHGSMPSRRRGREQPEPKSGALDLDDELLDKMAKLYIFGPGDDCDPDGDTEVGQPESSAWAKSRVNTSQYNKVAADRQCVICLEYFAFYDVTRAPCSHEYCRGCLVELFRRSLTDESLFPPRCCGEAIPVESNRIFLPPKLVGEHLAKKLEMETPNRTYCHQPRCSTFIPPQYIEADVGTCVCCNAKTCVICKAASHNGDCPEDPAVQELLRVADQNRWQRCYSCRRLVDLRVGCYHMTCLCRAEFCYLCAARWKTCDCPQWEEELLIERANVVVNRDLGGRAVPAARVAEMVEQARQQLVDDHECQHGSWRRIGGPRNCEECGDRMPIWLNVCRQCNVMVCRRCRYNRL